MKTTAFITGVTGQDGAYLAEFLLSKGYTVHGLVRWDCVDTTSRLHKIQSDSLHLHYGDMNDAPNLISLIKTIKPDEIYNLAALSHVKVSFETPSSALDTNAKGTLNILEAVRILEMAGAVRVYQASSSEMFGNVPAPQNEETPMNPCSPYGVTKLAAYHMARVYRESYGMHVSNGILFNHESPLRGEDFVTRKITKAIAAIEAGRQERLVLGNLDSQRDWGHARDYVRGMWMMLQQKRADDYVLATGQAHSVRDFVERAFAHVGIALEWKGEAEHETGVDPKSMKTLVTVDPALYRPNELHYLLGDAGKAAKALGWAPQASFNDLVSEMVNADRALLEKEPDEWRRAG